MSARAPCTTAAFLAAALLARDAAATKVLIPADVAQRLPPNYDVLGSAIVEPGPPGLRFYVVALGRVHEPPPEAKGRAPARPLLILKRQAGQVTLAGRNDQVVLRADDGGQCDPFLDGGAEIAVKGGYFTVENGVACGAHWTDYVTFRFDRASGGFVFDNDRYESWAANSSQDEDADAMVRDGPQVVRRPPPGRRTPFSGWRPER